MSRADGLLWGSFAMVCLLVLSFWLASCSAGQKQEAATVSAEALSCRAKISAVVQAAPSCGVAAAGVRQLIKEDPDCINIFLGHGIELTCKDGGQ